MPPDPVRSTSPRALSPAPTSSSRANAGRWAAGDQVKHRGPDQFRGVLAGHRAKPRVCVEDYPTGGDGGGAFVHRLDDEPVGAVGGREGVDLLLSGRADISESTPPVLIASIVCCNSRSWARTSASSARPPVVFPGRSRGGAARTSALRAGDLATSALLACVGVFAVYSDAGADVEPEPHPGRVRQVADDPAQRAGKRLISVGTATISSRAASADCWRTSMTSRSTWTAELFVADAAHGLDGMDGARGRAIDIEGQGPPVIGCATGHHAGSLTAEAAVRRGDGRYRRGRRRAYGSAPGTS